MAKPAPDILSTEHVVVTGAGRGIGAAIVRALAARGARLTLLGRSVSRLESFSSELERSFGRPFPFFEIDVSDEHSVDRAFDLSVKACGPVSILVNNAGLAESAPLHKTEIEVWDRLMAINARGVFLCTRKVLTPMLEAQRGKIINIASTSALRGYAYTSAYCASKHAVLGLTRALALEVAGKGVSVNALCPGYVDTDLLKDSIEKVASRSGRSREEIRKEFQKDTPKGRFVEPHEVAEKVLWLCLPEQKGVNGEAIVIEAA